MAVGAIEARFYDGLIEGFGFSTDMLPCRADREPWLALREIFAERSRVELCAVFDGTDTCVTAILSLEQAIDHPDNIARQTKEIVEDILHPRPAPRFSRSAAAVRRPPAIPGKHSSELLQALGWPPERVGGAVSIGRIAAVSPRTSATQSLTVRQSTLVPP